ncbi:unnamed protein product [Candidula unifasciata]|uniref:Uncharacterized protein n=1 Tax=Candidula unifasciata TaxID=100452 RepID=A0A8S4A3N8_9EUPU|nr:unnamed protein product [Candidula unifasciata]
MYNKLILSLAKQFPRVKEVPCSIFLGPPDEWNDSVQALSELENITEETFDYTDCSKLRARGFDIPTTDEENRFPIAFSIIVYTNMQRFTRLFRAVYRSSNVYCIHVDQKSTHEFKEAVYNLTSCFENVFVPEDAISVWWASPSTLEAEMVCLRSLWRHQMKWLILINLTGEEFPLRTNLELVNILKIMAGRNDVWLDPCTLDGPGNWTSNDCIFLSEKGFAERWENLTAAPYNIHPFKGQIHAVLSRDAVDYILHDPVAKELYQWISKAFMPDELFFSTINSNPHLKVPGSNPDPRIRKRSIARVKLWKDRHKSTWPYCSMYQRFVCLLTARELTLLTNSKQLVANKFKASFRPVGYSCLEQWYFERVLLELQTGHLHMDLSDYHHIFPHTNDTR